MENTGLCGCGCGNPTPLATRTNTRTGLIKGEPTRFIQSHGNVRPMQAVILKEIRKAKGRCLCGCGQPTTIAKVTNLARGQVKGEHVRYVCGHTAATVPQLIQLYSQLIIDPSGCLLWTGKKTKDGYGYIRFDGRDDLVHRVMYRTFVGPIPPGLELDHVKAWGCTHRHCASPAHLEPVTSLENKLRTGGIIAARVAATHCGTCGTPYDEENTYRTPRGHRSCRKCSRDRGRRYREQKRKRAA